MGGYGYLSHPRSIHGCRLLYLCQVQVIDLRIDRVMQVYAILVIFEKISQKLCMEWPKFTLL